jgi:predicted Rossmann fold flavoprotein
MRNIIVIGGGAAGLMAAGQAAEAGAQVTVLEKMRAPGRKLAITGKGRCNLTNVAPLEEFIAHFGRNGRFLHQAFAQFFSRDLQDFFRALNVPTLTERGGRVFPQSEEAEHIVAALVFWLQKNGVRVVTNARVDALMIEDKKIGGCTLHGKPQAADAVIVATGGASYPGTGSTGDGYPLAAQAGHTLVPVRPALVPLETAGNTAARLQGLALKNVAARVFIDGKKAAEGFGELLFTHFGLSGPIILTLSGQVVDALRAKQTVMISLDLKTGLDMQELDARLLSDWVKFPNRQFKTLLEELLPRSLIPVCIDLVAIPADKPGNQITVEERGRLRNWMKDFRLEVIGARPIDEAIVTAGGVELKEIDPRTMESRLVKGLYFAGEVLDLDANTGGYNLQAAFSTGYIAGRAAARQ